MDRKGVDHARACAPFTAFAVQKAISDIVQLASLK